jgi:hypothetical protein
MSPHLSCRLRVKLGRSRFRFLDLPPEICLMVYRPLFNGDTCAMKTPVTNGMNTSPTLNIVFRDVFRILPLSTFNFYVSGLSSKRKQQLCSRAEAILFFYPCKHYLEGTLGLNNLGLMNEICISWLLEYRDRFRGLGKREERHLPVCQRLSLFWKGTKSISLAKLIDSVRYAISTNSSRAQPTHIFRRCLQIGLMTALIRLCPSLGRYWME